MPVSFRLLIVTKHTSMPEKVIYDVLGETPTKNEVKEFCSYSVITLSAYANIGRGMMYFTRKSLTCIPNYAVLTPEATCRNIIHHSSKLLSRYGKDPVDNNKVDEKPKIR